MGYAGNDDKSKKEIIKYTFNPEIIFGIFNFKSLILSSQKKTIMSWKNFFRFSLILSLIFFGKASSQVCGGSFGAPIFVEDFGRVNNSYQTVSPALVSPAFTNYIYSSVMPPNDGYYTISNTTEYLPWGWQKSLDHTNDPSGTYGNMLVVNADYTPGGFSRNFSRKWESSLFVFSRQCKLANF